VERSIRQTVLITKSVTCDCCGHSCKLKGAQLAFPAWGRFQWHKRARAGMTEAWLCDKCTDVILVLMRHRSSNLDRACLLAKQMDAPVQHEIEGIVYTDVHIGPDGIEHKDSVRVPYGPGLGMKT
jgi:hypothetical protein